MVKVLLIGAWICAVTLMSSYGVVVWQAGVQADSKSQEFFGGLDYVKSTPISVPMIENGTIDGYVIAQFVFTVDGETLRSLSVPPDVFLVDEAFRAIYSGEKVNFRKIEKYDLDALAKQLKANINERFKSELVKDVLVEQFNYVTNEQVRNKVLKQG